MATDTQPSISCQAALYGFGNRKSAGLTLTRASLDCVTQSNLIRTSSELGTSSLDFSWLATLRQRKHAGSGTPNSAHLQAKATKFSWIYLHRTGR